MWVKMKTGGIFYFALRNTELADRSEVPTKLHFRSYGSGVLVKHEASPNHYKLATD